ncbi:MAG: MFS transporter [Tissierellia bacterium]|nr:MFS transporter [Tissierellia bacterium]
MITIFMAISFALKFLIRTPYQASQKKEIEKKNSFLKEFKEGLDIIKKDSFIRLFVVIAPLINFGFSVVFQVLMTYLLLEVYQVNEVVYGSYRSITMVVVLLVPIVILPFYKNIRKDKLLKRGLMGVGISLLLLAMTIYFGNNVKQDEKLPIVYIITLLDCIAIACVIPINISVQTFLQKTIPDAYRGRVLSVLRMLALSATPLGNMVFGILAEYLPVEICVFIASLWVTAVAVFTTVKLSSLKFAKENVI